MAIAYTKQMLIERIRLHLANDFPDSTFPVSENQVLLYIDAAIPTVMKAQMFEAAKVTSVLDIPSAYLVTYQLTFTQDQITQEWKATLPQPPLALPTGYDITDAYFASSAYGRGQSVYFVKTKRVSYRNLLPKPSGVHARIEGSTIWATASDGSPLSGETMYIQMPISRTADKNAPMNVPDDAIEPLFQSVIKTILQRWSIPKDVILDGEPAGNKAS